MTARLWIVILGVVIVALGLGLTSARADQPYGPGYCGYYDYTPYGFWYRFSYNEAHVPHFALYPPVYYSDVVPRSYGYSPFAYPPSVQTPEVLLPAPATISNPYVPKRAKLSDPVAAVTIQNQFVVRQ